VHQLPEAGFLRLPRIIGDHDAEPPIPAIFPVSKPAWWAGVRSGRYPQPVKLGPRTTAWDVHDIRRLTEAHRSPPVAIPRDEPAAVPAAR
jgi:predicted DNA-binding transcriptional regulator AlpA